MVCVVPSSEYRLDPCLKIQPVMLELCYQSLTSLNTSTLDTHLAFLSRVLLNNKVVNVYMKYRCLSSILSATLSKHNFIVEQCI